MEIVRNKPVVFYPGKGSRGAWKGEEIWDLRFKSPKFGELQDIMTPERSYVANLEATSKKHKFLFSPTEIRFMTLAHAQ